MGTGSYLLFTLDKVINSAVKQLVAMVNDATDQKMRVCNLRVRAWCMSDALLC